MTAGVQQSNDKATDFNVGQRCCGQRAERMDRPLTVHGLRRNSENLHTGGRGCMWEEGEM